MPPLQDERLVRLLRDPVKPLLLKLGGTFKPRGKILETLMPGSFPEIPVEMVWGVAEHKGF